MVGPHPQALVDEVVARASAAAVLLRSYPDACALGERHPGLAVHCGRLEAFTGDEPYDLVLALDGLGRTHSAEAPAAAWRESLAALAEQNAQAAELVKLRYFAGLTLQEAAAAIDISPRTADRLWAYAKAFLHRQLES